MAAHKRFRPDSVVARWLAEKRTPTATARHASALIGGALVCVATLWLAWLVVRQMNAGPVSLTFPLLGNLPTNSSSASADPLAAAGITLAAPAQGQQPLLTQQQATLLAQQMEPQVATQASGTHAQYTLFSYKGIASLHDVPAWLIHYTGVSEPHPDTSADPHASSTHHELYLFLDATSGKELLAIWI